MSKLQLIKIALLIVILAEEIKSVGKKSDNELSKIDIKKLTKQINKVNAKDASNYF
ncbi:hypothetical protein NW133_12380 [Staphylococcus pettenkoferi]|uniref:Uncharacterized protein n=1 Tax=Staphylococcus pettenkoferi TaxID=170573 RepID=A0ABT4BQA5_9STAP|nr:hypothetical protein [Staphylococcus pettenkoferi]MCY1564141.1 hypothetical protein [Staphylococcus pettenkoferi]MCY1571334.1 hypothetical protein [Staphylococcus pettenkoferi]MCY1584289.1 hypothetical protein [Staphylococcus pettenkoferi]MCY1606689.1 hypothetical protein [Staphylococcus pettenkoferi]MDH9615659.1 hypothetical protein [Staphylococcus pettenkoferi]